MITADMAVAKDGGRRQAFVQCFPGVEPGLKDLLRVAEDDERKNKQIVTSGPIIEDFRVKHGIVLGLRLALGLNEATRIAQEKETS